MFLPKAIVFAIFGIVGSTVTFLSYDIFSSKGTNNPNSRFGTHWTTIVTEWRSGEVTRLRQLQWQQLPYAFKLCFWFVVWRSYGFYGLDPRHLLLEDEANSTGWCEHPKKRLFASTLKNAADGTVRDTKALQIPACLVFFIPYIYFLKFLSLNIATTCRFFIFRVHLIYVQS